MGPKALTSATFSTRLMNELTELFENKKMCHVTFDLNGTKLQAHTIVLAARSPVFKAMFTHETREKLLNRVDVVDIEAEVFQEVLRFV